jgi:hypothetical protein
MLRTEHNKEHELPLALQHCGQLPTVGLIVLLRACQFSDDA